MKNLNITFEDEDFARLRTEKEDYEADVEHSISWEQFILKQICKSSKSNAKGVKQK